MLKILVFLFSAARVSRTSNVGKFEVPYEYLATRNAINRGFLMKDNFGSTIQGVYDTNCNATRCFFPIFLNTNDNNFAYQILTDTPSQCTSYPNCLLFTKTQYQNYSIVFGDPSIQDDLSDNRNYNVSKCGALGFTRANGLNWCFSLTQVSTDREDAESNCGLEGEFLNGFQFIEEQEHFLEILNQKSLENNTMIHLGAKRASGATTFSWTSSTVSTNNTLANNLKTLLVNGSGVNLVLRLINNTWLYDSVEDTVLAYYSCGWYAN
ncbi:unnamed protein product [Caenorhabditis angaria]|uniref:PAN-3 domain-containing protein n=1 Tax=Caenorhabditis angaria TaxID=860376 RepID=A0A9P1N560_9PELO|nr:unnamed protein product [Caenorhabditis angaria]